MVHHRLTPSRDLVILTGPVAIQLETLQKAICSGFLLYLSHVTPTSNDMSHYRPVRENIYLLARYVRKPFGCDKLSAI